MAEPILEVRDVSVGYGKTQVLWGISLTVPDTQRIGRTSITIHVRVYAGRRSNPEKDVEVTDGEIVFVAVDPTTRKPVPVFDT